MKVSNLAVVPYWLNDLLGSWTKDCGCLTIIPETKVFGDEEENLQMKMYLYVQFHYYYYFPALRTTAGETKVPAG